MVALVGSYSVDSLAITPQCCNPQALAVCTCSFMCSYCFTEHNYINLRALVCAMHYSVSAVPVTVL
jgi:hypothetical protein